MTPISEDRITGITEMRHMHVVHQKDILEFACVAENAILPDNDISPDICTGTDFGAGTDVGRSDDRRKWRQANRWMNKNGTFDKKRSPALRNRFGPFKSIECFFDQGNPLPRRKIGVKGLRKRQGCR